MSEKYSEGQINGEIEYWQGEGVPDVAEILVQLKSERDEARKQIENFLSYGQGGANVADSQLLAKLYAAEKQLAEMREAGREILAELSRWSMPSPYPALIEKFKEWNKLLDETNSESTDCSNDGMKKP